MIWKNFSRHLKRPDFYGHVHLSWSQAHFPLYWTHRSITQAETPVPCSCEQKLNGPGMTQASHSSWFELRKLGTCVFSVVSSVGTVWEVHAYINENSTHQSETKITDKFFNILFLIFIHFIPHEKCINHGIKYRRNDKNKFVVQPCWTFEYAQCLYQWKLSTSIPDKSYQILFLTYFIR